jgi:hypothetical protein
MTLSSLNKIAEYLEDHENSKRIKKLIFFACKNEWENDQETLDRFKLQELIQELSSLNPTIDHLSSSLSLAVKSLSKPRQYSIIASIVVKQIKQLYLTSEEETEIILNLPNQEEQTKIILNQSLNSEEETGIILNLPNQEEQTGIILNPPNQNIPRFDSPEKISSDIPSITPTISKKSEYNPFDLRQNIMRYTSPMRVKIILFSALYRQFNFNEQDWLKLKGEELDTLLRKLFDSCATIAALESKINNAVISLGNPDKNTQAGSVIIRVMRGLYSDMPAEATSFQESRSPANANYQPGLSEIDDFFDNDGDDDNTCQITVPPT